MRERLVLAVAAAAQVLALIAMIVLRLVPLMSGETILLRVRPVDPRDLFRGDYVILGYEFSQMPPDQIEGLPRDTRDAWDGREVYVTLVPEADGVHWRAERASVHPPSIGRYIRGRIAGAGRLEFGIEAFYVQEGKGREYEQAILDRHLSAEVALTRGGTAALRALRVE